MSEQTFDAFARRAGEVSRRGSLLTLGGAGLAALAGSSIAEAGKSNKKANRKARKKGKKKCKKQVDQCAEFIGDLCSIVQEGGSETCEAQFSPCCEFFAQCQATAFFDCFLANAA